MTDTARTEMIKIMQVDDAKGDICHCIDHLESICSVIRREIDGMDGDPYMCIVRSETYGAKVAYLDVMAQRIRMLAEALQTATGALCSMADEEGMRAMYTDAMACMGITAGSTAPHSPVVDTTTPPSADDGIVF